MTAPTRLDDDDDDLTPGGPGPEPHWQRVLGTVGMVVWVLVALAGLAWILARGGMPGGLPW